MENGPNFAKRHCYNRLSDKTNMLQQFERLPAVDAMIGRQKIGSPILGKIVQQSARADARAIIVKYNSCNGIFLGTAVA